MVSGGSRAGWRAKTAFLVSVRALGKSALWPHAHLFATLLSDSESTLNVL